jgi:hypothetical protein
MPNLAAGKANSTRQGSSTKPTPCCVLWSRQATLGCCSINCLLAADGAHNSSNGQPSLHWLDATNGALHTVHTLCTLLPHCRCSSEALAAHTKTSQATTACDRVLGSLSTLLTVSHCLSVQHGGQPCVGPGYANLLHHRRPGLASLNINAFDPPYLWTSPKIST